MKDSTERFIIDDNNYGYHHKATVNNGNHNPIMIPILSNY